MKRYLLFFAVMVATVSCNIRRQDKIADENNRQMQQALKDTTTVQLIDSVYDFGSIKEGDKVEYNFRFKNTGKKPLVVTDAHASCGCTVPEKPEKPVMPNETGVIKVIFNSEGKSGRQEKNISIESNVKPIFPDLKLVGMVSTATK